VLPKQGEVRAHFLHHLDPIFVRHLEIKNHETQGLYSAVAARDLNFVIDEFPARVDCLLAVDAVCDVSYTQLFKELL
jgi:hypothetical protein